MNEAHYPIQWFARLTGLHACVLRSWEQRYRAMLAARDSVEDVGALPIANLGQRGATADNLRQPARKAPR